MGHTVTTEADVVAVITRTLADLEEQGVVDTGGAEIDADAALFGEFGLLDSVGLVSLVVAVEQAIEDELGVQVGLADERALSQRVSPYRTIGTLAEYATGLLAGPDAPR